MDGVEYDVQEDCERVNDILLTRVRLTSVWHRTKQSAYVSGRSQKCVPGGRTYLPGLLLHDGTIPRRALPGVLEGIARLSSNMIYALPTSFMPETATCTRNPFRCQRTR